MSDPVSELSNSGSVLTARGAVPGWPQVRLAACPCSVVTVLPHHPAPVSSKLSSMCQSLVEVATSLAWIRPSMCVRRSHTVLLRVDAGRHDPGPFGHVRDGVVRRSRPTSPTTVEVVRAWAVSLANPGPTVDTPVRTVSDDAHAVHGADISTRQNTASGTH